ncbi:unnamed protein product, partial [Phaeothamnion confervicola]
WNLVNLAFLVGFDSAGNPQVPNFSSHGDFAQIATDIAFCQSKGVKILLSIGGATGSASQSVNAGSAVTAADNIWNQYLGGSSANRPFGTAVLDGIDLDIENADTGNTAWSTFVGRLRTKFATTPARKYYVAAAPQCPLPDAALGPNGGLALSASQVDLIFIQFYNNFCSVEGGSYNMGAWMSAMVGTASANAKLFVGVPASPQAAGSGYITNVATLNARINSDAAAYGSRFGGVMTWDAGLAGVNGAYWDSVRANMAGKTCVL